MYVEHVNGNEEAEENVRLRIVGFIIQLHDEYEVDGKDIAAHVEQKVAQQLLKAPFIFMISPPFHQIHHVGKHTNFSRNEGELKGEL